MSFTFNQNSLKVEDKPNFKLDEYQKEEIKQFLPDYIREVTEESKGKQYICPLCGSGTGLHRSGAFTLNPSTNYTTWTCFACGEHGDIFTLYQKMNSCDFSTACKELSDRYLHNMGGNFLKSKKTKALPPPEQEKDFSKEFELWHSQLNQCDYLTKRGISKEVQNKHKMGYCPQWRHSKCPNAPLTPRVIIPTSRFSFLARDTRDNIPEIQKDYSKLKEGSMHFFNIEDLYKEYCFIVEGEIDCASLETIGANAIGLGSVNQLKKLLEICKSRKPEGVLIFCLDNDSVGQKFSKIIFSFRDLGIKCFNFNICEGYKDANEILVKNPNKFKELVSQAINDAMELSKEINPVELKPFSWDFDGQVDRFLHIHGENIKYCPTLDGGKGASGWLIWNGSKWAIDKTNQIMLLAKDINKYMKGEAIIYQEKDETDGTKLFKEFEKERKKATTLKGYTDTVKGASFVNVVASNELDADGEIINTPNGYIGLKNSKMFKPNKEMLLTKSTSVSPKREDCHMFKKFLNDIFLGNVDLIHYVHKMFGYMITGLTREQKIFIWHGNGSNGKGVLSHIFNSIMNDYVATAQAETISDRKNQSGASSDLARLSNVRCVFINEPNEGFKLNEGLVKQLTGEDVVTARFLFCSEFEFVPKFKIVLLANHKPIIRGTDNGIWRRIVVIPFNATFDENHVDKDLKNKLLLEAPAIFNWFLEGARLYFEEGLQDIPIISGAKAEYKLEMDVVQRFIEAMCRTGKDEEVKASTLYSQYRTWGEENKEYIFSSTKFGAEISKHYDKVKRRDGLYYVGINLDVPNYPHTKN